MAACRISIFFASLSTIFGVIEFLLVPIVLPNSVQFRIKFYIDRLVGININRRIYDVKFETEKSGFSNRPIIRGIICLNSVFYICVLQNDSFKEQVNKIWAEKYLRQKIGSV